jgi:hypothetical protein
VSSTVLKTNRKYATHTHTHTHTVFKKLSYPLPKKKKQQRKIFPGPELKTSLIPDASTSRAAVSATEQLPRSQAFSTPQLV